MKSEEQIQQRIEKFRNLFNNQIVLEEFDREVFECFIDKVIIGETLEDGTVNPYVIRFICKGEKEEENNMSISDKQEDNKMFSSDNQGISNVLR